MTAPAQPDPAAQLRAAAQLLRDHVAAARENMRANTFWHCYAPETAWRDGLVNGFGGAGAEYAALMHPGVGEALAAWLDATAAAHPHEVFPDRGPCGPDCDGHDGFVLCQRCGNGFGPCKPVQPALAVARALLGGQP